MMTSDDLLDRCLAGDSQAQGELYRSYKDYVSATIFRVLGASQEHDDAVQDAFIEIFRNLHRFQGRSKLSTWIYRICVNVALQRIRQSKRQLPLSSAFWNVPRDSDTPQRRLERSESLHQASLILDLISRKKRTVFVLHEVLGFRSTEISELLGVNVLTVRTRLHYARKEFRLIRDEMEALAA